MNESIRRTRRGLARASFLGAAMLLVLGAGGCGDALDGPPTAANPSTEAPDADDVVLSAAALSWLHATAHSCPDDGCTPCPRAHPTPGSLRVTAQPGPASGALWSGWLSATVTSAANDNGVTYPIEIRWNLTNQTPVATVVQLVGGGNGGWVREGYTFGASFQDALAASGIRSVNVRYPLGADVAPRNGWVNISATLADAVTWMAVQGILEGTLIGYGNSGGSNMVAASLVAQGVPWDGVVLGGGPFAVDFRKTGCPTGEIGAWCFEDQPGGCSGAPVALRLCRGLLGPGSATQIPGTDIAVLVGTADPRATYLVSEGQSFLAGVQARSESLTRPATPHQVLNTTAGRDQMLQIILGWVAAGSGGAPAQLVSESR